MDSNSTAEPATLKVIPADLPVNATLHLWLKAVEPGTAGSVSLHSDGGKFGEVHAVNAEENSFRIYHVFGGGHLELRYDTAVTSVSVAYWFTPADVLETGITVLHTNPVNAAPDLPASYHFRPPFGWMNDPNGFGRFGGRPHLFYQHYSHGRMWNNMHWGHAVSSDYLRWRHLPVFLFPSEDLSARPDKRGGAFSGSAIPLPSGPGIRVFFTDKVSGRQPEQEIQMSAVSADLFTAGEATVILPHRPQDEGLTLDFRDPYVFKGPDGRWKMLLGSQSDEGGVILLYETEDPQAAGGWTYVGKLLIETRHRTTAIECPCLLPLDGETTDPAARWALIYGLMNSTDERTGRRNLTMVEVGWFDGRSFSREFSRELDFITDNYAFQAFVDGAIPVGIGWLGNWADTGPAVDFPSAMTLPRTLKLEDGQLLTPPIGAAESLRSHILDRTRLAKGEVVTFLNGAVEILFDLNEPGLAFDLTLEHPHVALGLVQDETGLWLRYGSPDRASPRYIVEGAQVQRLRIFLDYGSIEVFADGGRIAGTKRVDGFEPVSSARLSASPDAIRHATIWALRL
ncbi:MULTISPECIES: GH32 C-terminal domain-containing protein [Alphaproteobacteria]|uniref:beta-fructofuranosidase n=2 Tax=Alphaproteobacteria TaxID=28211 RepID=A0A512HDH8_9HYPH|nr:MULTISPECIES: GH32 C-terminal domain-containing protein [Alphaproteobacteria]GEO83508.1 beta-fructofuranosidase [Ciceribacter naphthalenivorans]GLR24341.1 beta-fructofuranosidase [Ciceribacter naphthalenivorans]GLT07197.1 beta-fructofuranosidase [Sphingomonas psychrolutea]